MKKYTFIALAILVVIPIYIFADYTKNMPVTLMQPNGMEFGCLVSGDEYYNWYHDASGLTIIQDTSSGYYYYAQKNMEV